MWMKAWDQIVPEKKARRLEGTGLNPPFQKVEETTDLMNDGNESSISLLRCSSENGLKSPNLFIKKLFAKTVPE